MSRRGHRSDMGRRGNSPGLRASKIVVPPEGRLVPLRFGECECPLHGPFDDIGPPMHCPKCNAAYEAELRAATPTEEPTK